jgi:hypothetical protein
MNKQAQIALRKVAKGILKEWNISPLTLSDICHIEKDTLISFLNGNAWIEKEDFKSIGEFIELYNCLTSYYVNTEDQKEWLNTSNSKLSNKTPLEHMATKRQNIKDAINCIIQKME